MLTEEYMKQYNREIGSAVRDAAAKCRKNKRAEVLKFLGDKCVRCGFTDPRALQIDHVNGDGGMKRRQEAANVGGFNPYAFYNNILKGHIALDTIQLLCANCNRIKQVENREYRKKKKLVLELPRY